MTDTEKLALIREMLLAAYERAENAEMNCLMDCFIEVIDFGGDDGE